MFSMRYTGDKICELRLQVRSEYCRGAYEVETNRVPKFCKSTETNLRRAIRTSEQANDNWPPVLTRSEAAEMCRISVQTFDSWVRKEILPGPIRGTRRWSRVAIEHCLAGGIVVSSATAEHTPFEQWKRRNAH